MIRITLLGLLLAGPAGADIIPQDGVAVLRESNVGMHEVIIGPVTQTARPVQEVFGTRARTVWHIDGTGSNTAVLIEELRTSARQQGFLPRFHCNANICGGFDFRSRAGISKPPEMFVNLGDFHYEALASPNEADWITLLVSKSGMRVFAEITQITGPADTGASEQSVPSDAGQWGVATSLLTQGRVILQGLRFETGSVTLDSSADTGLAALAAWLSEDTDRRLALVGHSDATGALETNLQISRDRAEQVRSTLIRRFNADPARIEAHGAAWLAPIAPNDTAEGRARNRRVEAVRLLP